VGGTGNVIGGTSPAARNIISGNGTGLYAPVGTTIVGNYFGTDASSLGQGYGNNTAILNAFNGIIGTGEPGAGNVITGNGVGVHAYGGENVIIRGNLIEPRADGSSSVGNGIGIIVDGLETAIGGMGSGEGNVIAFNGTGVGLGGDSSILSNLFYGNSFIDIDLTGDGPTPNDFGDQDTGPNNCRIFRSSCRSREILERQWCRAASTALPLPPSHFSFLPTALPLHQVKGSWVRRRGYDQQRGGRFISVCLPGRHLSR
jgi:hypothetical protein